jgi:hypothetical protein
MTGLVEIGAFPFVSPLPPARFTHVLPQYGCAIVPSLFLGFFLQCLGGQIIQQFPDCYWNVLAHITQKGRARPAVHVHIRAHARFWYSADVGTSCQGPRHGGKPIHETLAIGTKEIVLSPDWVLHLRLGLALLCGRKTLSIIPGNRAIKVTLDLQRTVLVPRRQGSTCLMDSNPRVNFPPI